ncbi:MAG: C10 family peptidase, partial [Bacteroidota bacterium]
IFNLQPTGFVIIAADDRYPAVLGFSDESNIDLSEKEAYVGLWGTLSLHEERIKYVRANNILPTKAIQNEWKTLRSRNRSASRAQGVVVAPLTTTKWNQGQYYNAECPANADSAENGPDGRTYCGCGPVAMAQLIKFHNAPVTGNGSNSYVDPIYGTQTADFCSTDYNWSNMPDELTEPNADVAKLIYHMGVSTYTYYSTNYTETYLSYMRNAFVNYFGFDQSANWFYDANNDFSWVARNDLDRGRPLLLSGVSVFGGAHTWVADGYGYFDATGGAGNTEYFHFNWGWGGDNNGWFLDANESWFPRTDDTTNVEITYYFDRYVIQNLFPASEGCQAPENFYANGADGDAIYLNVNYPSGEQDISFRYRKTGETSWTETPATSNYFQLVSGLDLASEYEFQARRKCCPSDWSPYTEAQAFTTAGFVPCTTLAASGLTTSSTTDNTTYVYTVQPFGAVENQFRYRPVGTTDWAVTDISTNYYRFLRELLSGTTYEFQVRQQCSNGGFTDFSASAIFTTSGEKVEDEDDTNGGNQGEETPVNPNCAAIDGVNLTTSSITETYAYIYTPQPLGAINNQFRYRKTGTSAWEVTDISTSYYRFLGDLSAGTTYEFQVRQECTANSWSNYSTSMEFRTTGTAQDDSTMEETNEEENTNTAEDTDNPNCAAVNVSGLFTSSVSNQNAYIYTPQPLGAVNNQFRYRPVGTTTWATTDISTLYYRYLSGLTAGTQYEFQTRQECSANNWSAYSESAYFTTTGGIANGKVTNQLPSPLTFIELEAVNPAYSDRSLQITVYPNPVMDRLTLDLSVAPTALTQIRVMDQMGRMIRVQKVNGANQRYEINVANLLPGVYLLQVKTQQVVLVKKFIKK